MEQQTAMTKWESYQALESAEQINTALLIASPALVAIIGTIFMMSTIRKVFELDDKKAFVAGIALSSVLGCVSLYSLQGHIHDLIGFVFYKAPQSYVAAVFLTPIANHVFFKLIMVLLFVMYQYSKNPNRLLAWFPYSGLSQSLYKMLTQKNLVQKQMNEAGEEEDRTTFTL